VRSQSATRFSLVLGAVLTALVGVQVVSAAVQRSADRAADSRVQLARDVEQIRYYDEVLTMSARLAAATGDSSYVERYRQAAPELDRVVHEAQRLMSDRAANDAVRALDRAGRALSALAEESFRRLAAGDRTGAYAAVNSSGYAQLKAEYRQGLDVAIERMQLAAARQRARATHLRRVSLAVRAAGAALLALLWAATARGLRRSQQARGQVEEQLRLQAHADPLTGLANRRVFREHLTTALATPGPGELAVLFADLDYFKTVNDTRGHAAGDALLVEVAGRVTDLLHGHAGAVAARLGGDELAVLLPSTDEPAARQFADRLVAALARPYAAAPQVPVTASVGLAVTAAGERDPGALLRRADLAMYHAKSGGRGRWSRYAKHMHTELQARVELENPLRGGVHPRGARESAR
jgi:diguanylate cyclase (GGDEF)-like protein